MDEQPKTTPKKFARKQFDEKFPNDDACLENLFRNKYTNTINCKKCKKVAHYYKVTGRKCYACEHCGYQIHPLSKTIFYRSSTPLKDWFYAIFLFGHSKNGVAAKELERQLGVTYKCAWRMANKIRTLFAQSKNTFSGTVEVDETYIGGKARGKRGRGSENKTPVVGAVERQGKVVAKVTPNTKAKTILPIIKESVKAGSRVITDEYVSYNKLTSLGYVHDTVHHASKQYVIGDAHTNTIEGFWSQLKRSIDGTYHSVSKKYLQFYVNEFVFRYNLRHQTTFFVFSEMMLLTQQQF